MSESTVPGPEYSTTSNPAQVTYTPAQEPTDGSAPQAEEKEKVPFGTPGYSTYTGPPFSDNPTKLPEPAAEEPAVGEG